MSELAERAFCWTLLAVLGLGVALPVAIISVRIAVYIVGALWGAALDPMANWFPAFTQEAGHAE